MNYITNFEELRENAIRESAKQKAREKMRGEQFNNKLEIAARFDELVKAYKEEETAPDAVELARKVFVNVEDSGELVTVYFPEHAPEQKITIAKNNLEYLINSYLAENPLYRTA